MRLTDPLPWIPIKYKLPLAFVLVCLVSLGAAGIVGYQATRDILRDEVQRDILTISENRAEKVVAYLDRLKEETEDFVSDGFIREAVYKLQGSPSPALQEDLSRYLQKSKLVIVPDFFEILVTDKKGRVMASSTPANIDLSLAEEPSFEMGQKKTFLGEIQTKGKGTDRPFFETAAPLKDKDNGLLLGVLVNRVKLENLSIQISHISHKGLTENIFGPGKQVDSYLVNRQGYLLTGARLLSSPDLLSKKGLSIPGSLHGREKQVLAGISPTNSSKKEVLFSTVSIPGTAWTLVTEIETRQAFLQAIMLQRKLFLVAIGMIGMILILVIFPLKLMIIPLIRLREAAEKIEKGEFPVSIQGAPNSEMGQLARAFNRLSAGLLDRTQKLEQYSTELQKKESLIVYERDLLNAIINCMKDSLIFIDSEDRIVLYNSVACEVFNIDKNQGKLVRECHPQQLFSDVMNKIESLKDEHASGYHRIIQHNGRIYEGTYTRVCDPSGNYLGIVLVNRDITERKKMEERLSRQEKRSVIGKISSTIAHEINNPLASIAMFSQLLEEDLSKDSPLREYTEVVQRNIQYCKKIIRAFQDYAVESPGERTVFHIEDCLAEVVTLARPLLEKSGIEMAMEVSEDLPPYEGDQDQIKQVFTNLVLNAIQAMEQGGTLNILAGLGQEAGEEAHILVEITDTGVGIEEAHLKEIFQPFFSTKAKGHGTGLGLSICQRFVEAHDGQIRVQSHVGCGTTFALILPLIGRSSQ